VPPGTVRAVAERRDQGNGLVYREARRPLARDAAPADEAAPESRVRRFIASDESVDSYNSRIMLSAWDLEQFRKNPLVFFGHGRDWAGNVPDVGLPIGKGKAYVDEGLKALVGEVEFFPESVSPLAERVLRTLDMGVLAMSVGFEPLASEYVEDRETGDWEDLWFPPTDYTGARLLELSVVTLPANPNAMPLRSMAPEVRSRLAQRLAPPPPPPPPPPPKALGPTREEVREMARNALRSALRQRAGHTR
jgi:hypothetical protein